MVSKLVTKGAQFIGKKIGTKVIDESIQKISKPYRVLKREVFGIQELNVGEDETVRCLKKHPGDEHLCNSVGDMVRTRYRQKRNQ